MDARPDREPRLGPRGGVLGLRVRVTATVVPFGLAMGLRGPFPTGAKLLGGVGARAPPDAERVVPGVPPTGALGMPAGAPDGAAGAAPDGVAGDALDGKAGAALDGTAGGDADVG
jgi:hypothetical protein